MSIHPINDHLYAVDSETSERSYTVNLQAKSCSCPHHQFRQAHRKHLQAVEAHLDALAERTSLERAAAKAANLTDEQLRMWAAQHRGDVAGCACLLELAERRLREQRDAELKELFR